MTTQYEAAAREAAGKPVRFKLAGERFATHVEIDGIALMEFLQAGVEENDALAEVEDLEAAAERDDDAGREAREQLGLIRAKQMTVLYDFLKAALPPREFKRFRTTCQRHHVGAETILQVARDVLSEMLARPTTPSSLSAASPIETGRTSTDGSLAPVASAG